MLSFTELDHAYEVELLLLYDGHVNARWLGQLDAHWVILFLAIEPVHAIAETVNEVTYSLSGGVSLILMMLDQTEFVKCRSKDGSAQVLVELFPEWIKVNT